MNFDGYVIMPMYQLVNCVLRVKVVTCAGVACVRNMVSLQSKRLVQTKRVVIEIIKLIHPDATFEFADLRTCLKSCASPYSVTCVCKMHILFRVYKYLSRLCIYFADITSQLMIMHHGQPTPALTKICKFVSIFYFNLTALL